MDENKPNNLPWVILGLFCGAVVMAMFGYGVYTGAKSEATVSIPEFTDSNDRSDRERVAAISIYVDHDNQIFIDKVGVSNLDGVTSFLESIDEKNLDETDFILRMSEKSSHKLLVSLKDILDEAGVNSHIEIVRASTE